ncbi:ZIP family metal transporter [Candidatus Dojkabacteria bacterium]|uniref:ZIP family metal transporter n=1 Tax=Candidatus Dojkabacteria bacterium TaxID=2099670 RepID=A0A955L7D6_9BACT|nr:ZIP family metal transporter [Candidatus Dojkabacteria bacterium]
MSAFTYSIISVVIVSLISLVGITTLGLSKKFLKRILFLLVSFATGALLGDVFLHILPHLAEEGKFTLSSSLYILAGIIVFFILEKIIHWRHCHIVGDEKHNHTHPVATLNLVGDGVHNFFDGILIGASFMVSPSVGIATSLAVLFHEIPQEIGDFGILVNSGLKPKKAILFNLLSAFSSIIGVIIVFVLGSKIDGLEQIFLPLTAGGFIYIAGADLIPELHHKVDIKNSLLQLISILFGMGIMYGITFVEPTHDHSHTKEHSNHSIESDHDCDEAHVDEYVHEDNHEHDHEHTHEH